MSSPIWWLATIMHAPSTGGKPHAMIATMATDKERRKEHRHAHKQRILRGISDELVATFDATTHVAGSNRSAITRQFWEWYVRLPGAKLPERPAAEKLES
jgi:hypothetical protein